jgi:uncharacterized phage infection (PIP) family protein YhgE
MSKKTTKVTLESLAASMEAGFKRIDGRIDGVDTKVGALDTKMTAGFKKVGEDIESLAQITSKGFEDVMGRIGKLDEGQSRLEQGQDNIQLRVDSLAPQFEVRELTRRVKRLEDRAGIRYSTQH